MSQELKNVIVIGAGGNLGPWVVQALEESSKFNISILSRKSSKSIFPSHLKIHQIDDTYPEDQLLEAFKHQDAIVSLMHPMDLKVYYRVIDSAVKAGVKRFIPPDFGSDSLIQEAVDMVPIFQGKLAVLDYVKSKESVGLTWIAIATGAFFDWGLKVGFFGFDLQNHTATIWDSGNIKFCTSNLSTVGKAVASTLLHSSETANKYIYVSSFTTSQNEILAALEKASGKKWNVEHANTNELVKIGNEKVAKGDLSGFRELILATVYGGEAWTDFEQRRELANGLLGLPHEGLDESVEKVVKG